MPRCRGLCGGGEGGSKGGKEEGATLSEDDDDDDDGDGFGSDGELEGAAERRNNDDAFPPSPAPLSRLTGTKALTRAAILSITGITPSDLRFIRFRSEAADRATLPYFLALDRPGPSRTHGGARLPPAVVLAIRGTLSASDVLTDALCEAERCDAWLNAEDVSVNSSSSNSALSPSSAAAGVGVESGDKKQQQQQQQQKDKKMYAHSGILAAAKAVAADVESEGTLESLLIANAGRQAANNNRSQKKPWRVVVTGHSLGAGVAALVALRLRAFLRARVRAGMLMPAFLPEDRPPNVACWSFAPPGGLACPALAAAAAAEGFDNDDDDESDDEEKEEGGKEVEKKKGKENNSNDNFCRIVSVAVGKDWIPRLSLSAVERLRDDMVVAAGRCAAPKALLLLGWAVGYRWPPGKLFRKPSEVPPGARSLVEAFRETLLSRQEGEAAAAAAEAAALASANAAAAAASSSVSSSSAAAAAATATAAASASAAAATVLAREREARLEGARSFVAPGRFMLLRPLKASVMAAEEAEAGKKKKKKKGSRKKQKGDESKAKANDEEEKDLEAPPPPSTSSPLPRHARAFEAVWVDHAALQREGILLSTRMALDHLPDYYISVLRRLSRGEYDGAGGGGAQPVSSLGPWDGTMMPPRGLFGDARNNANFANNNAAVAAVASAAAGDEGNATTTTTATTTAAATATLPPPPPPPPPVVALRGRRLSVGEGESRERRAAALEMQRRHRREQRGVGGGGGGKRGGGGGGGASAEGGGDGGPRAVPSAFGGGGGGGGEGEVAAPAASAAAAPPPPSAAPGESLQAFGSYFPASPARAQQQQQRQQQPPPRTSTSAAASAATMDPTLSVDGSSSNFNFNNPALAELARRVSSQSEAEALADGGADAAQLARRSKASKMRRDASSGLLSRAEEGRRR